MCESEHEPRASKTSYEEWVRHVFDHPAQALKWWHDAGLYEEGDRWDEEADPALTLSYLTRLFEQPEELIERYTAGQIDQGLYYLVDNSCSEHMFVLQNGALAWEDRRRCILAMIPLYAKLMAPVYRDTLGHTWQGSEDGECAPNRACYMWWDVIPLFGGLDHPELFPINDAVLHVFEEVLKLKSEACLESALHGLGHWHMYASERVTPIVRRFLAARTDISPALRAYAFRAAVGYVQ